MAASMLTDARNANLLRELTVSQFKLKDQSTFFGLMWSFLNPLLMVLILYLFFRKRFGEGVDNYGMFLLLGMVQYTHFANATNNSMRALLTMRQLTKETVFPKELIVLSAVFSNTIDFLIAMALCVVVAYTTGIEPSWTHLFIPAAVVLQVVLVVWVSFILSCLYPVARDIEHIYQVFLRALMFVTPIFYGASLLGEGMVQSLLFFNPLAHVIELSRTLVLGGSIPPLTTWLSLIVVNGAFAVGSWRLFKLLEPRLAEYV